MVLEGALDALLEKAEGAPNNVAGAKFKTQADQKEDDLYKLQNENQERKDQIGKLTMRKWIEKILINSMIFPFMLYKNSNK